MVNVYLCFIIALISLSNEFTCFCCLIDNKSVAVTYFEGIETYYKSLFETPEFRQMGERPTPHEVPYVRKLCKKILKSGYFRAKNEYWVEAMDYVTPAVTDEFQDPIPPRKLGGEYRRLKVFVDGEQKFEFLLTCFARHDEQGWLKMYLISPAYDVNSVPSWGVISGRFIFEYDNEDKLILRGLAEEPTFPKLGNLTLDELEQVYIGRKKPLSEVGSSTCDNADEDPVCQLTPGEKLRLCTTVLSSDKFAKKVKFLPSIVNVQIDCKPVHVEFRGTTWQKIDRGDDELFIEQAIGCKTQNYDKYRQQIIYFISKGCGVNQVFVYKFREGRVFVKEWMIRASVVKC